MSQENVEVVRRAPAALDRRDVATYLEVASPEIELVNPASPLEGPTAGHGGVKEFFDELESYAATSTFRVEEIRAVDDRVLAFFVLTAVGRVSEVETSVELAGVYDLEGGKIRRTHIFIDRAEALEAVGLSE